MKKTLQISLNGIVFNIEEDAYEVLKTYLENISTYFSRYADKDEILRDIENRIAELFFDKVGSQNIAINLADVERVVGVMGKVSDFDYMTDTTDVDQNDAGGQDNPRQPGDDSANYKFPKELYRDLNQKMLAGLCAGIANYVGVDPVWARLPFVLLLLGFFYSGYLPLLAVLIYIAGWIGIKGVASEETVATPRRKFYRNPSDRVVGGVASGLAAYFGVSVAIIRLIFLLSMIFGGLGVLIYFAFWFTAPPARTTTERMEMMGEPVTLSNIEEFLNKNIISDKSEKRSGVVSVLMLPLRLISSIVEAMGPILAFAGNAARVFVALVIMFTSLMGLMLVFVFSAGLYHLFMDNVAGLDTFDQNWLIFKEDLPKLLAFSGATAIIIPLAALFFAGLSLAIRRWLLKGTLLYILLSIWFLALLNSGYESVKYGSKFKTKGKIEFTHEIPIDSVWIPSINVVGTPGVLNFVTLSIKPSQSKTIKLIQKIKARGRDSADAAQNAGCIQYHFETADSLLTLSSRFDYTAGCPFRAQSVELTLLMPVEKKFRIWPSARHILRNTITPAGYTEADLGSDRLWVFDKLGKLTCLNCDLLPAVDDGEAEDTEEEENSEEERQ